MNLLTLPRYLLGDRRAILEIAGCRGALLLGGLFVLSAGFAREYDGEDLLAEPWHVLLPLAASLGTSLLLGGLLYGVAWMRTEHLLGFGTFYRSFLALYWMTAPLAWLYAVPYERFLSPADAVRANLWTLGVVSLWRVVLITRASSVLLGGRFWAVLMPVMLFADGLALVALWLTPLPVIGVMGGVRLTDSEQLIQVTSLLVGVLGVLTLAIWFIGTWVVSATRARWIAAPAIEEHRGTVSRGLWLLAAALLAIWIVVLPSTQPPQQLRRRVEVLFRTGKLPEGVAEMSRHRPEDYPPHWTPPPRLTYGEHTPSMADVLETVADEPMAPWVRDVLLQKVTEQWADRFGIRFWIGNADDATFNRYLAALNRLPEGSQIARDICDSVTRWWKGSTLDGRPMPVTQEDRLETLSLTLLTPVELARYRKLLDLADRSQ